MASEILEVEQIEKLNRTELVKQVTDLRTFHDWVRNRVKDWEKMSMSEMQATLSDIEDEVAAYDL